MILDQISIIIKIFILGIFIAIMFDNISKYCHFIIAIIPRILSVYKHKYEQNFVSADNFLNIGALLEACGKISLFFVVRSLFLVLAESFSLLSVIASFIFIG